MRPRHRSIPVLLTTALAVALLPLVLLPPAAVAHPDGPAGGERIAFSRFDPRVGGSALWTSRPDGSRERRLTQGQAYFPAWSPDRSRLVYDFPDDDGNQQIGTVDADGSGFRQLTDLPGISECADFSPDGRHIIFNRFDPTQKTFFTSLWVMGADGSDPHPLFGPGSTTFDVEPEYSPDGSQIVFGRIDPARDFAEALFVADADGTDQRRITAYVPGLEHPRWSPDGRWIVYDIEQGLADEASRNGIYLVRPNGRGRHLLFASRRLVAFKPDFSPDGRHVLFGCFVRAEQQEDLCVIDAKGNGAHRVIRTPTANENWPVWS